MSNLWLQIVTPYLPIADGLTVEFWPTDAFIRSPVGNARAYPGAGSPTATATTSGGLVELTGLTDTGYASVIDSNGKPWFMAVSAGSFGNSSSTPRRWGINPAPAAAGVASSELALAFGTDQPTWVGFNTPPPSALQDGFTVPYMAPLPGGGGASYLGRMVETGVFAAGDVVIPFSQLQFIWPEFDNAAGSWTWELIAVAVNPAGTQSVVLDTDATAVTPVAGSAQVMQLKSADQVSKVGTDLVYHSGVGYETTAGGFFIIEYRLSVIGGTLS